MNLVSASGLLVSIFLPSACASVPKDSPKIDAYKKAVAETDTNPIGACEAFTRLTKDDEFPLARLAAIHAHGVCPDELKEAPTEPWLRAAWLKSESRRAQRTHNTGKQIELGFQQLNRGSGLNQEEKVNLLRELLQLADRGGLKKQAKELKSLLHQVAPRLEPNPPAIRWIAVADDWRRARDFAKAKRFYRKVLRRKAATEAEVNAAWRGLIQTARLELNREEQRRLRREYVKFTDALMRKYRKGSKRQTYQDNHHDAVIALARLEWTMDNPKAAEQRLRKLKQGEALWLLGRISEERGDWPQARTYFRQGLAAEGLTAELQDKLLWGTAWMLRREKNYSEAITAFDDLRSKTASDFERFRAHFWSAQTLWDLEEKDKAHSLFRDLIEADPLGFYGLMARRAANSPLPPFAEPERAHPPPPNILDAEYWQWLMAAGEGDIALRYLNHAAGLLRRNREASPLDWVGLLQLFAESGRYLELYRHLGLLTSADRQRVLESSHDLVYPQPHLPTVENASQRFKIPVELIYAIMRQESAFHAEARSPMDAMGLLQVLPTVAAEIAKRNDLPFSSANDLNLPERNISIGAALLSELWTKYQGRLLLVAAAYNASEDKVETWLKTRYRGQTLEFLEDVPYEETRAYMKLILRNFVFYGRVRDSKTAKWTFPDWTLRIEPVTPGNQAEIKVPGPMKSPDVKN